MQITRIDRLVTLFIFHIRKIAVRSNNNSYIPILMYHSISEEPEGGIHPYYRLNTSPEVFGQHMKYLYGNGYSVVGLRDAIHALSQSGDSPEINAKKHIVITFDDGFRDFYTEAFPVLRKYEFTATVYLPTDCIQNNKKSINEKKHLSWNEVKELHAYGISFGSHTVTHPKLHMIGKKEIEFEIRFSKETIEDQLGSHVDSFAYPYAFPEE